MSLPCLEISSPTLNGNYKPGTYNEAIDTSVPLNSKPLRVRDYKKMQIILQLLVIN